MSRLSQKITPPLIDKGHKRANEFIQIYNEIVDCLNKILGNNKSDNYLTWYQLVEKVSQVSQGKVVRHYMDLLKSYGSLRNAIIHEKGYPSMIIAEPTEAALQEFKAILQKIRRPETVMQRMKMNRIKFFDPEDMFIIALMHMKEHDYSQIVVWDQDHAKLLTADGILNFIEHVFKNEERLIDLDDVLLGEVLQCEPKESVGFISKRASIYEANHYFANRIETEPDKGRLFGLLVSENGRSSEKPLGIITQWDCVLT